MKHILTGAAALLCTTSMAMAGGLDRSGQPIGVIFEQGNHAELSIGMVNPNQNGSLGGGALQSGDINPAYAQIGAAVKWDLAPNLSAALIYDQPFGAAIVYPTGTGYLLAGTSAHVTAAGITGLLRYKINPNFSIHGGIRHVNIDSDVQIWRGGSPVYVMDGEHTDGFGYVIGAAYEKPEIALRAAITYSSAIDIDQDVVVGGALPGKLDYELPQSVNIDLQTGIAARTLAFASIRWSDWTAVKIDAPLYPNNPLVSYDENVWEYEIGIGRQLTDTISGSISYGYEASQGGLATNLSPSDGLHSITVGAKFAMSDSVDLSTGMSYQWRGSATTEDLNARFNDNSLLGIGMKIAYSF